MIYEVRSNNGLLRRLDRDDAAFAIARAVAGRASAMPWARARELAESLLIEAGRRAPMGANLYGVSVKAIVPVGYARAVPIVTARYRDVDCPNCRRRRVEATGICEKCGWDVDGGGLVHVMRPRSLCILCRSECNDFGDCTENHGLMRALGAL